MRIRQVKPAFWRSDDIDALTWEERLVFIAIWSYVDDNGVGRDKLSAICADLFANDLSVDPTETLRRVSLCLDGIERRHLITRYKVENEAFLFVVAWDQHQIVKNPGVARYPRPDKALLQTEETLPPPSVDPTETLPTVVKVVRKRVGKGLDKNTSSNAAALDGEFDKFWTLYPRKVGKGQARNAYRSARRKVPAKAIASALHVYARAVRDVPRDKIRHPTTWLNGEPWHDDPEAIAPPSTNHRPGGVDWDAAAQHAAEMDAERERL